MEHRFASYIRNRSKVCSLSRAFENERSLRLVDDLAKFTLCLTRWREAMLRKWTESSENSEEKKPTGQVDTA